MHLLETSLWAAGAVGFYLLARRGAARLADHMRDEAERLSRPAPGAPERPRDED
jgi:hypothetical protein